MFRHASRVVVIGAVCACGNSSHNNSPDAAKQVDAKPVDAGPADAPPVSPNPFSIPLTSLNQLSYTGPLHVGGQAEQVILDTGSTTFGIASSTCTACGVSPLYTPGASAVDQHMTGSSMYADGTGWSGEIYEDLVQLGSGTDADVELKFVAIGSSSGFFRSLTGSGAPTYQGILGLGPDGALIAGTTSYATTAFGDGVPKEFAFQLCPANGTMWMGEVDTTAEASAPAVTALISSALPGYLVTVDNMAVGSGSAIGSASDFGPTIIDTGTSISFIPATVITSLTTAIQASTGYQSIFGTQSLTSTTTMGCVTTAMTGTQIDAALPPLHVAFPNANGSGDTPYVDLPATKSYLVFLGPSATAGQNNWCFALVDSAQLTGGQINVSLFGDSMLNAYLAVFDIGHKQMQFAATKGCGEADAVALPATRAPMPMVPGIPWWQQDPDVRVPRPDVIQREFASLRSAPR